MEMFRLRRLFTMRRIGAVVLAFTLTSSGSAAAQAVVQKPQASKATDLSARHRTPRYAGRYDRPVYDDRPEYYRPYPHVLPAPFPLGLGFGPWW
jgi:hypothetical protein